MADSNQSGTEIGQRAPKRSLGRRNAAMSRHEAETLQFLALVESRRPVLAALLAFARSPTVFLLLALGGGWLLGGGRLVLQALATLMRSLPGL